MEIMVRIIFINFLVFQTSLKFLSNENLKKAVHILKQNLEEIYKLSYGNQFMNNLLENEKIKAIFLKEIGEKDQK